MPKTRYLRRLNYNFKLNFVTYMFRLEQNWCCLFSVQHEHTCTATGKQASFSIEAPIRVAAFFSLYLGKLEYHPRNWVPRTGPWDTMIFDTHLLVRLHQKVGILIVFCH